MKNKILILLGMLILMIGLSSIVSAVTAPTCTIVRPASNSANTGTILFNATITSNGTAGDFNVTGINFSTTTDGVVAETPHGVNQSSYQVSVDTSSLTTEIRQTTVTASIITNSSAGTSINGTCTSTLVDFDNTNPVCSSITPNFVILEVLNPLEATCISTDTTDLTLDITLCTADSQTCTTETKSSSAVKTFTATFEAAETLNLGEATISCIATDEVNKQTACSNQTITIKGDGKLVEDIIITGEEVTEGINIGMIVGVIIGVVILLILVLFVVIKPKKKR